MAIDFYPEGTTALPSDYAKRSLTKILDVLNGGLPPSGSGSGLIGNSDPEGVVTADPGTTYYARTSQTFWVKETGTGTNTGWTELI